MKYVVIFRLETLLLNDTGIENIYFPDCPIGGTTAYFSSLQELFLYHNKISEVMIVEFLQMLTKSSFYCDKFSRFKVI